MSLHQGPFPGHHDTLTVLVNQLLTVLQVLHSVLQVRAVGWLC